MVELKREYVVPLRRKCKTAPNWRRSKKAIKVLKEFIAKHMKSENIILCNDLNHSIWKNGAKNPPGKVSVLASKIEIGGIEKVLVNLKEKGLDEQLKFYVDSESKIDKKTTEEKFDENKGDKKIVEVEAKEVKKEEKIDEKLDTKVVEEKPKNTIKSEKKTEKVEVKEK